MSTQKHLHKSARGYNDSDGWVEFGSFDPRFDPDRFK